ncbi:MAG TPA: glutamate mutase L, partial [Aggregatilineales bacterium]|nr:glutamate mutase L [Aggregatilineales bacterium]
MQSFLVSDFGIAYTRTIMIDVVEGQYRLISGAITRTTSAAPDRNVGLGLIRNIQQLQEQTGRVMIGDDDFIRPSTPEGKGFDVFLATASSAGRPLRAVLVALMDDFSLVSAERALTGTYIERVETLSLIDIQTEEDRINTILRDQPDVIFIAGGTNDGNEDAVRSLIRLVELAVRLEPVDQRPIILYAGNERLSRWAMSRFEQYCVVFTASNIRPDVGEESLSSAKLKLAQVFDNF